MKLQLPIHKDLHRKYFAALFPPDPSGHHPIDRKTDLGRTIYASVQYSDTPPPRHCEVSVIASDAGAKQSLRETATPRASARSDGHPDTNPCPLPIDHCLPILLSTTSAYPKAPHRFLYFTRDDITRINDLIEVLFNIDLDRYYLRGLKLGYLQREVIESFIIDRGLVTLLHDHETLKKRQQRSELALLRQHVDQLLKKARDRNVNIGLTAQHILQNIS